MQTLESPELLINKGFLAALAACGVTEAQIEQTRSLASSKYGAEEAGVLGPLALQAYATALVEITRDAGLGMRVAAAIPVGATGVVEYILLTAPSLRAVHQLHAQFSQLTRDYMRFAVGDEQGLTRITLRPPVGLVLAPMLEDYRLSRIVLGIRRALLQPGFAPVEVCFTYPRPSNLTQHQETFGRAASLRFGQPEAGVSIPSAVSDQPLPTSDPPLHTILLAVGRQLLSASTQISAVSARVRQLLIAALHEGRPSIAYACKQLGMSERTLRRRLSEEGTSFAALLDQVRAALVQVLAQGVDPSEKSLTTKLGFESTSALRRARKRWARRAPLPLDSTG